MGNKTYVYEKIGTNYDNVYDCGIFSILLVSGNDYLVREDGLLREECMDNSPEFTVIIPVYNVAPYLRKCISSVLEQEFQSYELILVDDGSTDGSKEICDEYTNADSRIKVLHQKNQGASVARNKGIEKALGEYIIFLDGDDYWYDKKVLNKIYLRLKLSNAEVLSFNYVKIYTDMTDKPYLKEHKNMPLNRGEKESLKYQIDRDIWLSCPWNKVIKRRLFDNGNLKFRPGITSEDIDWCFRLALYAERFDFIADVIVCYRQRQTSISNAITVKKMDVLIDNIEECLSLLIQNKDNKNADILKPYIGYQYGTAIYLLTLIDNKKEYKRLISRLNEKKNILKWSHNPKIRLIRIAEGIGGIKFTVALCRIKDGLKQLLVRE